MPPQTNESNDNDDVNVIDNINVVEETPDGSAKNTDADAKNDTDDMKTDDTNTSTSTNANVNVNVNTDTETQVDANADTATATSAQAVAIPTTTEATTIWARLRRAFVKVGLVASVARTGIQSCLLPRGEYDAGVYFSYEPRGSGLGLGSGPGSSSGPGSGSYLANKCESCGKTRRTRKPLSPYTNSMVKRYAQSLASQSSPPSSPVSGGSSPATPQQNDHAQGSGHAQLNDIVDSIHRTARYTHSYLQLKVDQLEATVARARRRRHRTVRKRQRCRVVVSNSECGDDKQE